jgi:hypothetical protein
MKRRTWQLPWEGRLVPHALLDILRGCNITCRACYNLEPTCVKSLAQVEEEFAILRARRRLDSLSIVGGEPTLHPQLLSIVRLVKSAGVSVELFTNGLLLTPVLLRELKAAGTDLVFLHIDAQQQRPDMASADPAALDELRAIKAAQVVEAGMEVGLTITVYRDALEEVDRAVQFVLDSPHVDYFLGTLYRDVSTIAALRGNMEIGFHGSRSAIDQQRGEELDGAQIVDRLSRNFGLQPFAYVGSNRDMHELRWVSYLIAAAQENGRTRNWSMLRASLAERAFLRICRQRGRYPFYIKQDPRRLKVQLLLNAASGGRLWANLRLLAAAWPDDRQLRAKRLLFQSPAQLDADGQLRYCRDCPDATVRHGRLTPVCIADRVVD